MIILDFRFWLDVNRSTFWRRYSRKTTTPNFLPRDATKSAELLRQVVCPSVCSWRWSIVITQVGN